MSHLDTTSPFLPLPDGVVIASVHPTASRLVVQVACCHPSADCPLCQEPSEQVHGDYVRTVADWSEPILPDMEESQLPGRGV